MHGPDSEDGAAALDCAGASYPCFKATGYYPFTSPPTHVVSGAVSCRRRRPMARTHPSGGIPLLPAWRPRSRSSSPTSTTESRLALPSVSVRRRLSRRTHQAPSRRVRIRHPLLPLAEDARASCTARMATTIRPEARASRSDGNFTASAGGV